MTEKLKLWKRAKQNKEKEPKLTVDLEEISEKIQNEVKVEHNDFLHFARMVEAVDLEESAEQRKT